jgi:hypothetical protein
MTEPEPRLTSGCLCGALRYEAVGEPDHMGHCYCEDCRKASGSGFIPFIGFPASAVRFIGQSRTFTSKAANGGDAACNFCPVCGGLSSTACSGLSAAGKARRASCFDDSFVMERHRNSQTPVFRVMRVQIRSERGADMAISR